jgi:hypothetical protein
MQEMNLTRHNFRRLCECLTIPMIEIKHHRLVDPVQFLIAMKALMRIGGNPLYLCPGCHTLEKAVRKRRRGVVPTLNPEYVKENLTSILAELIYSKDNLSLSSPTEALNYAKLAAERLHYAALAALPAEEQAKFESEALKALRKKFGPTPEEVLKEHDEQEDKEEALQ